MTSSFTPEWMNSLQGLTSKLGIKITEMTPERVTGTMPVEGNVQPYGLLHGGASASLAETLGSIHAGSLAPVGKIAVGTELSCSHHRSARSGTVTAVSTPAHVGRSMASFEIVIADDRGKRICTARLSCAFVPNRTAEAG